ADDGEERRGIVATIILIVDEAGIVDAATIDVVHVPAGGMEELAVGREVENRIVGGDRHGPQGSRYGNEAHDDFCNCQNEQDGADGHQAREQPLPPPGQLGPPFGTEARSRAVRSHFCRAAHHSEAELRESWRPTSFVPTAPAWMPRSSRPLRCCG